MLATDRSTDIADAKARLMNLNPSQEQASNQDISLDWLARLSKSNSHMRSYSIKTNCCLFPLRGLTPAKLTSHRRLFTAAVHNIVCLPATEGSDTDNTYSKANETIPDSEQSKQLHNTYKQYLRQGESLGNRLFTMKKRYKRQNCM
jgi:hypothetical protein